MEHATHALFDALRRLSESDTVPMHMPGHKRSACGSACLDALGARYDITEIDGFDNLHGAEGILKQAMARAAQLWGSVDARFLVNGSTCGLLAGIRAATRRGDTVLVARNCHKAVYHALELCGLVPVYLLPKADERFGFYTSLPPQAVEAALAAHPSAALVVLTSPTYEGVLSDVASICSAAHRCGVPVLVDEAHGAHLGLHDFFAGGAVHAGADIVVQSLHKTLPSLTQTALLHRSGTLVSQAALDRQLAVFETSSPSYLLMAAIDSCVGMLRQSGAQRFAAWERRIRAFDESTAHLRHLQVAFHTAMGGKADASSACYGTDPGKLVVSTRGTSLTGPQLAAQLRAHGIEPEMTACDYVIAMTGMGDSDENLVRLAAALREIDSACTAAPAPVRPTLPQAVPQQACSMEQALAAQTVLCTPQQAAGGVSAEFVWAYPPGIPLLVPGERIDAAVLSVLAEMRRTGVRIYHSGAGENGKFLVAEGKESPFMYLQF